MPDIITCIVDGAARNNGDVDRPNEAAAACVIFNHTEEVAHFVKGLGPVSNNVAEYEALISCLLICSLMNWPRPTIYCDSLVVVNHAKDIWDCKSLELLPHYMTLKAIQAEYSFDIVHVPRKKVHIADKLCNDFLDGLEAEKKRRLNPRKPKVVKDV